MYNVSTHDKTISACAPLYKMAHNKAKSFSINKEVYQFSVASMSYMNLIQNKELKDNIDKFLSQ